MKRFRLSIEVDAESPEGALEVFSAMGHASMQVELLGYVNPRADKPDWDDQYGCRCAELAFHGPVPQGYVLRETWSEYYGSHPEYGEGDEQVALALPEGATMPEGFHLSHGSFGRDWNAIKSLPEGALVWRSGDDAWSPVSAEEYSAEADGADASD